MGVVTRLASIEGVEFTGYANPKECDGCSMHITGLSGLRAADMVLEKQAMPELCVDVGRYEIRDGTVWISAGFVASEEVVLSSMHQRNMRTF